MTPSELMALADSLKRDYTRDAKVHAGAIAALRSYAELLSAAEFIQERCITNGGRYFGCPLDMLLQQATEAGWPGLEET